MTAPRSSDKSISRRKLFRYGGGTLAVGLIASLGWQFRPVADPDFRAEPLSAGPETAPEVLVVYASMMGSTSEQAGIIADELRKAGMRTRLACATDAPDPAGFDAVILGSAVRGSAWLDEILEWAGRHEHIIAGMPHALFQCSMQCAGFREFSAGHGLTGEQREILRQDLRAIHDAAPELSDAPVEFFAGKLDWDHLKPQQRIFYPVVAGSFFRGDHRRPEQVRAYTRAVLETPRFTGLRS
ncbi:MAG: flavodoxin domain-containing protein [Tropicimonas sp.]|uniref:flavodoxin domain-containing protein n=1 Tax=Tropicimonas sp. TaxID=2067044 RepID=UPI003A87BDC6